MESLEARPPVQGTVQEYGRSQLVNRSLNPLLSDLPARFSSFRPWQIEAVDRIVRGFRRGVRVVVLDAPTGSGKTLIGETVRRMAGAVDGGRSAAYVCSDRALQDQFHRDFPYSRVLMGRSNYPTVLFRDRFAPGDMGSVSCEDCTKTETSPCILCPSKGECPYEMAKSAALRSFLPVLNTSYFLTEANGPGRFSGRPLVILDEADLLERALMGYVSVAVSELRMSRYGWRYPKLTVEKDWGEWAEEHSREAGRLADQYEGRVLDTKDARELRYLNTLCRNLGRVARDIASGESAWVYDGDRTRVSFKPCRVMDYGNEMLWRHGATFLLMSASIVSADETMRSLGWRGDYETVTLGSTFPIENRRVIVKPVGDMGRKNEGRDDASVVGAIRRILFVHPSDRILIHAVSYARTVKIVGILRGLFPGRAIFSYTGSDERANALARYKATAGSVLIGPSLDRGVDLPGDLCRVQVIVKVPYPHLGDKVVNKRFHSGQEGRVWYTMQTVRTLVQMTGRAVRDIEDWAVTYILDSAFGEQLWSRGGRTMFPDWWKDGIVWERPDRDRRVGR